MHPFTVHLYTHTVHCFQNRSIQFGDKKDSSFKGPHAKKSEAYSHLGRSDHDSHHPLLPWLQVIGSHRLGKGSGHCGVLGGNQVHGKEFKKATIGRIYNWESSSMRLGVRVSRTRCMLGPGQ